METRHLYCGQFFVNLNHIPLLIFKIGTLFVFAIWSVGMFQGCQPISSRKQSTVAKTNTPREDEAVTPISTNDTPSSNRRKIPTLREQMEKLQTQQDATIDKIEAIQQTLSDVQRELVESRKQREPLSSKPALTGSESSSTTNQQQNGGGLRQLPTKSHDDATADSHQKIGTSQPSKPKTRLIYPDGVTEPYERKVAPKKNSIAPRKKSVSEKILVEKRQSSPKQVQSSTTDKQVLPSNEGTSAKSVVPQTSTKPSKPVENLVSADYNTALTLFSKKDYKTAISLLEGVAAKQTDPNQLASTYYWMGESQYGLGKYGEAIKSFEKVTQNKKTDKADDAHVMIAESLLKMGKTLDSKKEFQKIEKSYPTSELLPRVRKKLQQL